MILTNLGHKCFWQRKALNNSDEVRPQIILTKTGLNDNNQRALALAQLLELNLNTAYKLVDLSAGNNTPNIGL